MSEGCDPLGGPTDAGTTCPVNPVEECFDGKTYTECTTDEESNPWFVFVYDTPITVTEVVLTQVSQLGNYSVYVTNDMPVKGEVVATGNLIIL